VKLNYISGATSFVSISHVLSDKPDTAATQLHAH
jgi:hypothetical protein